MIMQEGHLVRHKARLPGARHGALTWAWSIALVAIVYTILAVQILLWP